MDKCQSLADEISTLLQEGIQLDSEVLSYIDSTFSYPTSTQIEAVLNDPDHSERDALVELIFFPDEIMRLRIENLLERFRYREHEEEKIIHLLQRRKPSALIRLSDDRSPIRIPLPPESVKPLIRRLRITIQLPEKIINLIDRKLPDHHGRAVKVRLRCARIPLNDSRCNFISDLLQVFARDDALLACFDFALQFLEEIDETDDYYSALVCKRRSLVRNLKKMEEFRSRLEKENMETLVMRGERIPLIDITEAQKQIAMIDQICIMIFGTTDIQMPQTIHSDHIECSTDEDLKRLVRQLS